MEKETFYYSENLIIEIIKTYKLEFIEDISKATSTYFINPSNMENIEKALNKYIIHNKKIPNKILSLEDEYSLEYEKEKYREFKAFYAPKTLKR